LATILFFGGGLVLLLAGAEWLVRGASRLASAAGVSPLVVGLTVVAFGTGAPEMAVSVQSAVSGNPDLAYGNVVGSNIVNVLLILGASTVVAPLRVARQLVRLDVPIMIGASMLCFAFCRDGAIGRGEGVALLAGSLLYTGWLLRQSRKGRTPAVTEEYAEEFGAIPRTTAGFLANGAFVVSGLSMLIVGSRFVVSGAVELARFFGMSELVIGITVIALGTSLPELATSVLASLRGERDLAIGNVVGSNIFNILAVLGIAALVSPVGVTVPREAVYFDTPVMVAVAFACLPVFANGFRIARWEGFLFLFYYGAYLSYILLDASGHEALPRFSSVMTLFVIPLTVLTLGVVTIRSLRGRRAVLP
jgi:cation:H+ antiporter